MNQRWLPQFFIRFFRIEWEYILLRVLSYLIVNSRLPNLQSAFLSDKLLEILY
jgi:hypothetical protein